MNSLSSVINDIVIIIAKFLNDREKILFLSSSNRLHLLKNKIHYNEVINIMKIKDLTYYDMFTNVCISNLEHKPPKSITHLYFDWYFNEDIKDFLFTSIMTNLTHIIFSTNFNKSIKGCIPNSVTYLHFGDESIFNQDIEDCIPNAITHLFFGCQFNKNIKACIPNSVTHLVFGPAFNQNIEGCIPNSMKANLTHLFFTFGFNQDIKGCIPNSVTHLFFGYEFNRNIKGYLPKSLKYLVFGSNFDQQIDDECLSESLIELVVPDSCKNILLTNNTCKIIRYSNWGELWENYMEKNKDIWYWGI